MTVGELIEELQKYDDKTTVITREWIAGNGDDESHWYMWHIEDVILTRDGYVAIV